jgi:predicted dehydrogenase
VLWWSDRIWYNLQPDALVDWYFDPAISGGGVLVTNGVHALDRARWILGPLDISSFSMRSLIAGHSVEDSVIVTAQAGAAVAEISLMWAPGPIAPSGTVIVGSRGTIVVQTGVGWTVTTTSDVRSGSEGDELEPFRRQWQAFRSALGGAIIPDAPTAAALESVIDAIARMYDQPKPDDGYGVIT